MLNEAGTSRPHEDGGVPAAVESCLYNIIEVETEIYGRYRSPVGGINLGSAIRVARTASRVPPRGVFSVTKIATDAGFSTASRGGSSVK